MRRWISYALIGLAAVALGIGVFFFLNNDGGWESGIYFRKTYGYIGFINEEAYLDLFYYNIKEDEKDFENKDMSLHLVTGAGEEVACDVKTVETISRNRNYSEKKLVLAINLDDNSIVSFQKLKAIHNGVSYVYDIGDVVIENIKTENLARKLMRLQYGMFQEGKYELTITNISDDAFVIAEVKADCQVFEANNEKDHAIDIGESKTYVFRLKENLSKSDIIYIRPVIVARYLDGETSCYDIVSIIVDSFQQLSYQEVHEFTKDGNTND